MHSDPLISQLNDKQQEAVLQTEGPVLVLAGAGSGKTRVLTHRIAYILREKKAYPEEILAVTFTNKAANEIKERISKLLTANQSGTKLPWAGTFHSICARILRIDGFHIGLETSFTIYDPQDQLKIIKDIIKELDLDPKSCSPKAVLNFISSAKNELVNHEEYALLVQGFFQQNVAKIYPLYQRELRRNQALDFDDLIMRTIELFKREPKILEKYQNLFKYILVDEYQDTNYAQYTLIKLLAALHKNIFVVGDDAQSIYGWRGADIRNILNFESDYSNTKVIKLEQNYRSTQTILDASNKIITFNPSQKSKKLWTENAKGDAIKVYRAYDEKDEAEFIAHKIKDLPEEYDKVAVLYRTNAQSRTIEETMLKHNIPYKLVGNVRFYERKEIKDIIAYLRIFANSSDDTSFARIINTPRRGIGNQTILKLKIIAKTLNTSMVDSLKHLDEEIFRQSLNSSTLKKLSELQSLINRLFTQLDNFDLINFIKYLLEESKLTTEYGDKSEESIARIENIKEFINIATKYKNESARTSLPSFLEDITLIEEQTRQSEKKDTTKKITLMTIHSAKGLEFEYVFITGLEENLFPHSRSYVDPKEMEEERRLAYVAITRAKNVLYLTYSSVRTILGSRQETIVSRFIEELPQDLLEFTDNSDDFSDDGWVEVGSGFEETTYQSNLTKGDKVKSEYFGLGEILSVDEDIIKVKFLGAGIKELSTEYARLEKI